MTPREYAERVVEEFMETFSQSSEESEYLIELVEAAITDAAQEYARG